MLTRDKIFELMDGNLIVLKNGKRALVEPICPESYRLRSADVTDGVVTLGSCLRDLKVDDIDITKTLGKLILDIQQNKNVVTCEVLYQDESFRGNGSIVSEGSYSIHSARSPAIKQEDLFINGCDQCKDYNVSCYSF